MMDIEIYEDGVYQLWLFRTSEEYGYGIFYIS